MRARSLLAVAALACGCATSAPPARKAATTSCPESQDVCLNDRRCDYDARRDCMVCACRGWDDRTAPGSGPATNATPEGSPTTRLPPPPPGR